MPGAWKIGVVQLIRMRALFTVAVAAAAIAVACVTGDGTGANVGFGGIEECRVDNGERASSDDGATPYICRAEYVLADEADSPATILLSGIPNLPEYRELVRFDDFAAVARIHGIERPSRDSSNDVLLEYARSLVMADMVDPLNYYPVVSTWREHSLISPRGSQRDDDRSDEINVADADVIGIAGPWQLAYSDQLEFVLGSPDEILDIPTPVPREPSVFNAIEYKLAYSDTGRFAIGSLDSERVDAAIRVVEGDGDSIYREVDFVDAMRALYGLGAVSGTLSDRSADSTEIIMPISDGRTIERDIVAASVNSARLLTQFSVAAVGSGIDESGTRFTAIALVHKNEKVARENVGLLAGRILNGTMATFDWPKSNRNIERDLKNGDTLPWSTVIERAEISVSGRILLVRLYGIVNPHALTPLPGWLGQIPVPGTLLVY